MDAVITYVDNTDPTWQRDFVKYYKSETNEHGFINEARYRPWNNLQYCLRAIACNAPFIRKVHVIVSSPSQVPSWLNTDTVNIVYHKDIIPEEYLPTFNSRTIEMCMHKIQDLDEEFIYFNDDMFLIRPLHPTDFFIDGKPTSTISCYTEQGLAAAWGRSDIYFLPHKRCTDKVRDILKRPGMQYYLTNHGPSPFLKSNNKRLFNKLQDEILPSLNKFRTKDDFVHFMYSVYNYLRGDMCDNVLTNTYVSSNKVDISKLAQYLANIKTKTCCINDIKHIKGRENYENDYMKIVNDFLDMNFPNVCKYENQQKVGLCVIVKNENKYLKEFCEYYKYLGFHKIYLYDNNDKEGENPKDVLSDYINENFVIYHNMRGIPKCQQDAYNNCYCRYSDDCDWIAFFDADEFLELYHHTNISSFISQCQFNEYQCICVNWRCYGDNQQLKYDDKSVLERFTTPADDSTLYYTDNPVSLNYFIKSIVKTKTPAVFQSVHYPKNVNMCNTNGEKCYPSIWQKPIYCNACLKHYITKSFEEYVHKCIRGYPNFILNKNEKLNNIKRYFSVNNYYNFDVDSIVKDIISNISTYYD